MTCKDTTGHCIISSPSGDFSVCCPPLFDGPGIPDGTPGKSPECWVGLPGSDAGGLGVLSELVGCGTGCMSCSDDPANLLAMKDSLNGERWLAPDEKSLANRDARGLLHDLRSGEGHLIPTLVRYIRGTCFSNDAEECFDNNTCTCWGVNSVPRSPPEGATSCEDGTALGGVLSGLFPDRFFFVGQVWPYRDHGQQQTSLGGMYCRRFPDTLDSLSPDRDHRVVAVPSGLFGIPDPVFMRTEGADSRLEACVTNMFVVCVGKNKGGTCPGSFSEPSVTGVPPPEFYNNGTASRQRFNEMRILANTAHIRDDSPMLTEVDKADIAARNRVLDTVKTTGFGVNGGTCTGPPNCIKFDRLDSQVPALGNGAIGAYWRVWSGRHLPQADRPTVPGVFGQCEMFHAGCPVTCELHIDFVLFQCKVIAHALTDDGVATFPKRIEPHARARILVECSIRATLDDDCVLSMPWSDADDVALGIVNPEPDPTDRDTFIQSCLATRLATCLADPPAACFNDPQAIERFPDAAERAALCCEAGIDESISECQRQWISARTSTGVPAVVPDNVDRIVIRDPAGRIIRPPLRVEWLGYLGYKSQPSSIEQAFNAISVGDVGTACSALADSFTGIEVPAWPYIVDDNDGDPAHVYGGSIVIGFEP